MARYPLAYGPLWSLLTGLPVTLGGDSPLRAVLAFKALSIGAFLAAGWLIYLTARRMRPDSAVPALLAFAWNPLAVFHIAGNGHNDAVMVCLVALTLYCLARRWAVATILALTAALLLKAAAALLVPLLALWWLRSSSAGRSALRHLALGSAGAVLLAVAVYLPFWSGPDTFRSTLNEGSYYTVSVPAAVRGALMQKMDPVRAEEVTSLLMRGTFLAALAWICLRLRGDRLARLVEAAFLAYFAYLVLAGSYFAPWYVLWALVFAVLLPFRRDILWPALTLTLTAMSVLVAAVWFRERFAPNPGGDWYGMHLAAALAVFPLPVLVWLWALRRPPGTPVRRAALAREAASRGDDRPLTGNPARVAPVVTQPRATLFVRSNDTEAGWDTESQDTTNRVRADGEMYHAGQLPRSHAAGRLDLAGLRAFALTHWGALAAVAVTLALGGPTLFFPYGPDQALFAYFGGQIAGGADLYVDLWDVKPPGIFWVYSVISLLPGPDFKVLRLADLLYTCLVVVAVYAVAATYWNRLAGAVAGTLYGGTYIIATGFWHTAQPDSFMVLPLMLALLTWERARGGGARAALATGALLGLCTQFRPPVLLIGGAIVLIDLLSSDRNTPHGSRSDALHRALLLAGGAVAVEALTLLWLALHGAVGDYLYAQLVFAPNYARQGGPYSPDGQNLEAFIVGLRTSTMFIIFARVILTAPALFALLAGVLVRRERRVTEVSLYLLAAFLAVAVQAKFFLYHWHVVFPFLALLCGWSAAFCWRWLRAGGRSRVTAALTLATLGAVLLLLTPAITDRSVREWQDALRYVREPEWRRSYYDRFGLYGRGTFSYRASDEVSTFIRRNSSEGDTIFVWGYDPLVYIMAERESASRFVSFLPLMTTWTPQAWLDQFVTDLERERPAFILLQRGENARWITGHYIDAVPYAFLIPRFRALLERDYVELERIEDYFIYQRR